MAPAPPLLLIGSTNSYFTLKVRGYLKWKGVAFEETVPSAELYRTYLAAVVKVQQMPVLVDRVRKEAVVDTSTIIDYVEKWYSPSEADAAAAPCLLGGAVPAAPRQRAMCYLLETFADEWLKFPAMHYRWSFPSQRAATAQDFGELLYPAAAQGERLKRCGSAMAKFGGFLAPLGIHAGTTAAGVERAFRTLCERLTAHLECFEFLFGAKPTLADFAFAGPFAAHLCRDPVPAALVRAEYPLVATWVERVQLITPPLSGRGWVVDGEGLPVRAPYPDAQARRMNAAFENDGIPASLERVLDVCFEEHAPILINTHAAVQQYLARTPTAAAGRRAIPRIIGFHPFRIGGVDGKRAVWPLDLWKLARGIPASHDAKAAVRTYVASRYGANGRALMDVMDALPPLHLIDGTKLYTALPKGGAHAVVMVFGCCTAPPRPQAPAQPAEQAAGSRRVGDWLLDAKLGATKHATVRAARNRASGADAAVKMMKKTREGLYEFQEEMAVLRFVEKHVEETEHMALLLEAMQSSRGYYLVLECAPGQDLRKHLTSTGALDEGTAAWVFSGVAAALAALQRAGVAHRDIKLSNIVVDFDTQTVKLIDFGLAKVHEGTAAAAGVSHDKAGTPGYAAPEVMLGRPYNSYSADAYSLGVTLYAAVTLEPAVAEDGGAAKFPRLGELSAPLQDLILQLTATRPQDRLPLSDVLAHEWFTWGCGMSCMSRTAQSATSQGMRSAQSSRRDNK